MEISTETIDKVPPKSTSGLRRAGSYHPDVLAIIEEVRKRGVTATKRPGTDAKSNLWDAVGGENPGFVQAEFENYKVASTRALSLRKAGYVGVSRGTTVLASMDSTLDYSEDTAEDADDNE